MAIEHACTRVVRKPWGSTDLLPWSSIHEGGTAIGELWFQRPDATAPDSALLLKLLFTQQPLSIQVHPDDVFAKSIGLGRGKTEAWYILSAAPGAEVAVGLKRQLTGPQLRTAIEDGSIADLVQWRGVRKGDIVFVPAGTIHAIGPGLVIAEIQQRSDTTYRLFDYGRHRDLDVDKAVATAHAGPAEVQEASRRLTDARLLLVASPHFILERITLAPRSNWELDARRETWLLVLEGDADIGTTRATVGEAMFVEAELTGIAVGADGLTALVAYLAAGPSLDLLRDLDREQADIPIAPMQRSPLHQRGAAGVMAVQS
jgi:mannose-6-phosphate isomerase